MPPTWLTLIAWIWLGISLVSSGVILFDIFVRGHRQPMGVMDAVYPITALYLGAVALAFYWRWARSPGRTSGAACIDQMAALPENGDSIRPALACQGATTSKPSRRA
jgi:hypothetical protein